MYTIFNILLHFLKPAMWPDAYLTWTSCRMMQRWNRKYELLMMQPPIIYKNEGIRKKESARRDPQEGTCKSGYARTDLNEWICPTVSARRDQIVFYQPVGLSSVWPTGQSKNNHTKPVIVQIFFNFVGLNRHQQHKNRLRVAPDGLHLKQDDGSAGRVSK